ncbi:MAG TPA: Gfo/Idh/MocA family oxidoreductase [Candidatus Hydrogenedentes bacterium]|nr:Gfo/Idh/MocA family oxidoreductase [Candidatus Hydrogenedentota bacterium]HPG66540.1 Gfo/Idh/MocA family oxidoreductase [Candidatus Hydrogenedentota bacterium]
MKRIGLMGCGTVAGYGHLPALDECPEWDLVALFDPDKGHLETARKRFNVPNACTDVDAFFASGLDAVTITSPAPCHIENVREAVRYRIPILCEKPLAMTDDEAVEMIAMAKGAGVRLFTGFTYRFAPEAQAIKRLVEESIIGDVRSLRLIYIWNCHGRYALDENGQRIEQPRRAGRMLEGGPLVDCGVHQIDLARWWLGSEIVRQQSAGAWLEDYEAPDHVYVHLDHANGAHTAVEMSYSYCHTAKEPVYHYVYDLIGTEGVIRYTGETHTLEVRSSAGTTTEEFAGGKNFVGLYQEFARAVETGEPGNMPTAEDGRIATRIARTATDHAIANRLAVRQQ